jgi:molybdate transport system substrate-binding protein
MARARDGSGAAKGSLFRLECRFHNLDLTDWSTSTANLRWGSDSMRIGFGTLMAASAVVVAALVGTLMFTQPSPPPLPGSPAKTERTTLLLYCAAGLQPPIAEITSAYEASHPVTFEMKVGGSGTLLSQIIVGGGDVFIAADRLYLDSASQKHLAPEIVPIAYQYPVILVQKGNPKKIAGLSDLLKADLRLSLADPKQAAIGKVVSGLLQKEDRWEALWKKAIIHRETVNEVGNDVKLAAADAGIVWNATAAQYPDLVVVHVLEFDRSKNEIAVGLLSSSKDPQAVQEFIRYIADPKKGLPVFARHGYEVVGSKLPVSH